MTEPDATSNEPDHAGGKADPGQSRARRADGLPYLTPAGWMQKYISGAPARAMRVSKKNDATPSQPDGGPTHDS